MSSPPESIPIPVSWFTNWVRNFKIHQRIPTGLPTLPWTSVFVVSMIWLTFMFHIFAGGISLTYTVKRYHDDPRLISLITTLSVIIMLGPFVSYISDNIWTKIGRRKPFVLIAYSAGAWGMAALAFLPQINTFLQPIAHSIGLPSLTEPILLVAIVVSYTTLMDFQAPLEPLLLECVPPKQRGRFFALRSILGSIASFYFYQLLWPVYDLPLDIISWMGLPANVLVFTGEQVVYIIASCLYLISCFIIVVLIDEVKRPDAPNKRIQDLGVVKFAVSYVKDVFMTKSIYPFYIVMVIPGLAGAVWGNFDALMKTDQFQYTKGEMALMGLPSILLSIFLLAPFAGWYSDKKPEIRNSVLVLIGLLAAACFAAIVPYYSAVKPIDSRTLPAIIHCLGLSTLVALGGMGVFVIIVEIVARRSDRIYMRIWISLIALIKDFCMQLCFFLYLQFVAVDSIPPITLWMIMGQTAGSLGVMIGICVGPMIYEYIPRNQLGTVLAGKGLLEGVLRFGVANLGAVWVVYWSLHVHKPAHAKYDYTSLYVIQMLLYIPAIIAQVWFLRKVLSGIIQPSGILEVDIEAKEHFINAEKDKDPVPESK